MLKWQTRIACNTVKSFVPFQNRIRSIKHSFKPPALTGHHEALVRGILEQIEFIGTTGTSVSGARVLEIGSGWLPVAPLIYRLAGAREVVLTDQYRLLNRPSVLSAVDFVISKADAIAPALGIDPASIAGRLAIPREGDLPEMLAALDFTYLVPMDEGNIGEKLDIAYSHTVLEHIPPQILGSIFKMLRNNMRNGAIFCNGIDNSDHRKNYDSALSIVDFLKYSEASWKLLCIHPQDYTNRLRHSDYLALLAEAGFEVLDARTYVAEGRKAEVAGWSLPPRFASKTTEDLCTTWSLILARA
ncbi:hypothetical protein FHS61_002505 [Altererythrobacter atlanticus]|uniref:Uncharacterized protein n=1 Tax=Croceibacterium atlanticum TaxID=1267766 RepID=A0A0F7KRV5_9SPHN|nr:hypothetical protein [Croceibacterium atlanticum]AKH41962.1 hypothetical protein WYH_00914 [Croceibacterium atlanticum]MBB5733470.1 hypothetical protein [Croceibacterium atlanticum]